MEPGKKSKQKKRKNKQGKKNESVPAGVGEPTSENTNHVNVKNHQNLNSENADVQNKGLQQAVVNSDRQPINGAETSCSIEAEKSYWLKREASLEQKIKELQGQLDMHLQRETDLERNISQSLKERNLWHKKEAELERRILQLQTEKDSWLQKEAGYEEKVNRLVEETSTLRSMGNSAAETIASLNKDNARLRAQVIELEASKNNVFHQNQQLKEHVSDLQSKIQDLESSVANRLSSERTMHVPENGDMKSQLESTQALVEKVVSENEKLVEKVNNLNTEFDQKSGTTQSSLPIKPDDPIVRNSKPAPMPAEKPDTVSDAGPSSGSKEEMVSDKVMDEIRLKNKSVNHMNQEGSDLNPVSRVSMESGEIVQIPLDESDVTVPTSTASVIPEKVEVPLTDAPLIGAPFRLISFVARYVSGADLVEKG